MSARPARRSAPFVSAPARTLASLAAVALLAACGGTELVEVKDEWSVVGGQPGVDPARPTIERAPGEAQASDFASSTPVQLDAFEQRQVSKVDILWVIDNSGSMAPKQQKVRTNFQAFMRKLSESAVDYHIGVVTTDTASPLESGRLQKKNANLAHPWIDRSCQLPGCDPVDAFSKISNVGITGSGDEKGLLAASLALSPPLITGANAGFLRDDAALFMILLSDEEDSSCGPSSPVYGGGCETPSWGEPAYYARWLDGLKGFGRKDLVTVGAIVALAPTVTIPGTSRQGCKIPEIQSNETYAYGVYAPRYMAVAEATGGLATDICSSDYLPALENLGFLATGAKSRFTLSRVPVLSTLRVTVRKPGGQPVLQTRGVQYDYEPCGGANNSVVSNAIRFSPAAIPPAGAVIEIEYEVFVGGRLQCP